MLYTYRNNDTDIVHKNRCVIKVVHRVHLLHVNKSALYNYTTLLVTKTRVGQKFVPILLCDVIEAEITE